MLLDHFPLAETESVAVGKGVNKEEFSNLLPELSNIFIKLIMMTDLLARF